MCFGCLVRVSQNLKFLYCASIFIGNFPVSALHALLLQYLFTPSNHFKNLIWTTSSLSSKGRGGWGEGVWEAISHTFSQMKSIRYSHNLQSAHQGSCSGFMYWSCALGHKPQINVFEREQNLFGRRRYCFSLSHFGNSQIYWFYIAFQTYCMFCFFSLNNFPPRSLEYATLLVAYSWKKRRRIKISRSALLQT